MQTSPSQEIIERVFQIIADLKSRKEISGINKRFLEPIDDIILEKNNQFWKL